MTLDGIDYLHVKTIQCLDNTLLISFVINNRLKDLRQENNYGVFSSYYMAKKQIKSKEDVLSAFDINTYSEIYFVDTFVYQNSTYPLGPWIIHQPIPVSKDTFKINVMHFDGDEYGFGGLATIDISDPKMAKMIDLDKSSKPINNLIHKATYQDRKFFVEKAVIDESKSLGEIRFVPTEE